MRNRTEDQVTLALIRHGETRANREGRYLGRTDEPLSETGRAALLSCREQGIYPETDYLFAGPMKRCAETAALLYPALRPVTIPEWTEMDFGAFEYRTYRELQGDERYQAWLDGGGLGAFPEGESREAFVLRCREGMARMCAGLCRMRAADGAASADRPARAVAVVHGGTIMALLSSYGERDYFDCRAANGRGYVCRIEWEYRCGGSVPENLRMTAVEAL